MELLALRRAQVELRTAVIETALEAAGLQRFGRRGGEAIR